MEIQRVLVLIPKVLPTMLECVFVTNWTLGENGVHGSLVLVTSMAKIIETYIGFVLT